MDLVHSEREQEREHYHQFQSVNKLCDECSDRLDEVEKGATVFLFIEGFPLFVTVNKHTEEEGCWCTAFEVDKIDLKKLITEPDTGDNLHVWLFSRAEVSQNLWIRYDSNGITMCDKGKNVEYNDKKTYTALVSSSYNEKLRQYNKEELEELEEDGSEHSS